MWMSSTPHVDQYYHLWLQIYKNAQGLTTGTHQSQIQHVQVDFSCWFSTRLKSSTGDQIQMLDWLQLTTILMHESAVLLVIISRELATQRYVLMKLKHFSLTGTFDMMSMISLVLFLILVLICYHIIQGYYQWIHLCKSFLLAA